MLRFFFCINTLRVSRTLPIPSSRGCNNQNTSIVLGLRFLNLAYINPAHATKQSHAIPMFGVRSKPCINLIAITMYRPFGLWLDIHCLTLACSMTQIWVVFVCPVFVNKHLLHTDPETSPESSALHRIINCMQTNRQLNHSPVS